MSVEIISIGDELLLGLITNTNASFLARELSENGYFVSKVTTVSDRKLEIEAAFASATKSSELIFVTGGLGPTLDDITLEVASSFFQEEPKKLESASKISHGFYLKKGQTEVFFFPGFPRGTEEVFFKEVLPFLQKEKKERHAFTYSFSVCFIREEEVDPFLVELKKKHPEIEPGIYSSSNGARIVLKSFSPLEKMGKELEEKFQGYTFREETLEKAIHSLFIREKKTLALAESCSGGKLAARFTEIPDASLYFLGSVVSYSNAWKEHFLKVSKNVLLEEGAVSKETVEAMIQGLFSQTDADYAIALSGTLGPKGGTKEKPVGTVYIGIGKRGERSDIGRIKAPQDRRLGAEFSVETALGALFRRVAYNKLSFS